jgi:hypothetical protein
MAAHDRDRLLVKNGFKHFRRSYDLAEVRWGFAVLAVLVAITTWVVWKGRHPPADLYSSGPLAGGKGAPAEAGDRGPVPDQLAPAGWQDRGVSSFDPDNLYVKINGRADFFLSKGFVRLYALTLTGDADAVIDLELYDMGSPQGALAAFSAEKKEGAEVSQDSGAQFYRSRNALFVVKGKHYARAIGSAETPAITEALEAMREALLAGLDSAERPWAYELFETGLGIAPDQISFVASSAFSVEGLDGVWVARKEGEVELFASSAESPESASKRLELVLTGLAAYGKNRDGKDGARFVVDEFLGTYSSATASGPLVLGVKGAADETAARAALAELEAATGKLSAAAKQAATTEASERANRTGDDGDAADDPGDGDDPLGENEGANKPPKTDLDEEM